MRTALEMQDEVALVSMDTANKLATRRESLRIMRGDLSEYERGA